PAEIVGCRSMACQLPGRHTCCQLTTNNRKENTMIVTRFAVVLCTALLASFAVPASAWNRLQATQFATLPAGTAHPEGITADAHGNFYVADFDVSGNTSVGTIIVFDRTGRWLRTLQIDNGSAL